MWMYDLALLGLLVNLHLWIWNWNLILNTSDVCTSICVYWPSGAQYVIHKPSLPLTGFWWRESTKLRGFSMVYFKSRTVCEPPPSDHSPFLTDLAWSSKSHSLACSGLKHTEVQYISNYRPQSLPQEFWELKIRQDHFSLPFFPLWTSMPWATDVEVFHREQPLSQTLISSSNEFVHYQKATHVSINFYVVLKAIIIFKGN